jgi:peptidoglycan/LPS O-acetylase OafA/YrhL
MTEEMELQKRSPRPRLFQLDALRGVAAVTVVLNHLFFVFPISRFPVMTELISDGRSAVVLFFVLSGYVLSLPVWSGRSLPYGWYLIRRFCRIYLPFAAAAALSILFAYWFRRSTLSLTPWFNQTWHTPITPNLIIKQFLMVPMNTINTAFWSLTYEMQMSIAMPLICLVMIWLNPAIIFLLFGALVFVHPMNPYGQPQYPALTYQILFLFMLGATLARYKIFIEKIFIALGRWMWLFLFASLYLYYNFIESHKGHITVDRIWLINGLGSAGIIVCSLHLRPFARLLQHSIPEYLGRISYSLYLVHGIVIFALIKWLYLGNSARDKLLLGTLIVVVSFAAAHLFCIVIEEPSMRLGKRLGPRSS